MNIATRLVITDGDVTRDCEGDITIDCSEWRQWLSLEAALAGAAASAGTLWADPLPFGQHVSMMSSVAVSPEGVIDDDDFDRLDPLGIVVARRPDGNPTRPWIVDWAAIGQAWAARQIATQSDEDRAWLRAWTGADPLADLDVIDHLCGTHTDRPAWSQLVCGRVRPSRTGRWVAEHGQGGTLVALGEHDTIGAAEDAVRQRLRDGRDELATSLHYLGGPHRALAPRVRAMHDRIVTWATEGDRIRETARG